MKYRTVVFNLILLIVLSLGIASYASAQAQTEVFGFYQGYRNFSFNTGYEPMDIEPQIMRGGGGGIAQYLAPWFALWTQVTFYGTVDSSINYSSARVINNLQGVRYQTKQYGVFQFYGKGGLGFSYVSVSNPYVSGGSAKFSAGFGGGMQAWVTDYLGLTVDVSLIAFGLPNLTNLNDRDTWDSGVTISPGLAFRF